jgi:anaerobic glycerol-3-phosphate dehydrogenase
VKADAHIIGGGAGMCAALEIDQRGLRCVILEAGAEMCVKTKVGLRRFDKIGPHPSQRFVRHFERGAQIVMDRSVFELDLIEGRL